MAVELLPSKLLRKNGFPLYVSKKLAELLDDSFFASLDICLSSYVFRNDWSSLFWLFFFFFSWNFRRGSSFR